MNKLKAIESATAVIENVYLVYRKPEADKYINLLKDKANYNEYAYKLKSEELADTCRFYEDELRHQKYRRCLAMAMRCAAECVVNQNTYKKHFTHKSEFRIEHFRKWYFRLLELAEKFKEAK